MKQTAIVTGASRGIGWAVARQLGLDGYQVVLFASSAGSLHKEKLEQLEKDGIRFHYVQGHLERPGDRERLLREAVRNFGEIHVLVNNAGVAPAERTDLLDMTEESFDRVLEINTKGTMFLTQIVAKQMLKQPLREGRRGVIVNISSCSAEVVSLNRGEYCVSKAGIAMLTKLYAARLAGDGILVHEIRPGVIRTDMTSTVAEKYDGLIQKGSFPIARWGSPQDIADAVSLFCDKRMQYTTGNYIDIDGGFHLKQL